jgi:hypothetical protein
MRTITCEKCGQKFLPTQPRGAIEALMSERRFLDVAPELREAETAICTKCGHKQPSTAYRFFGFLTPSGVRVLIALIILGMLAFAIWWRIWAR